MFRTKGALGENDIYVPRAADKQLLAALREGELCAVLATRQIGKTSLGNRTIRRLDREGVTARLIDLNAIGGGENCTEQEWYADISYRLKRDFNLDSARLERWELETADLSVQAKFEALIHDVILQQIETPVVLIFDEIDNVRSLKAFSADAFFALIRSLHQAKSRDPLLSRLTICLMGTALLHELIHDSNITPFNVGREITLEDFSIEEMGTLEPELRGAGADPQELLREIFAETHGHPMMTTTLCKAVLEEVRLGMATGAPKDRVRRLVQENFERHGRGVQPFHFAESRYSSAGVEVRHLYRRLLAGDPIEVRPNDVTQMELRLTGLAAQRHDQRSNRQHVKIRNPIFQRLFDSKWYEKKETELLITVRYEEWLKQGKPKDRCQLHGETLSQALDLSTWSTELTKAHREYLLSCITQDRRRLIQERVQQPGTEALDHLLESFVDRECANFRHFWDKLDSQRHESAEVRSSTWAHDYARLKAENQELRQEQRSNEELRKAIADRDGDLLSLRNLIRRHNEEVERLNQQLEDARKLLNEQKDENSNLNAKFKALSEETARNTDRNRAQVNAAERQLSELQSRLAVTSNELTRTKTVLSELRSEHVRKRSEAETAIAEHKGANARLTAELGILRGNHDHIVSVYRSEQKLREQLEREIEILDRRSRRRDDELRELIDHAMESWRVLAAQSSVSSTEIAISDVRAHLCALQNVVDGDQSIPHG